MTAEDIRNASFHAAKKVIEMGKDEQVKARIAAISADALKLARDCLDDFLVGYQEGKNEEIRNYIQEQTEREQGKKEDILEQLNALKNRLSDVVDTATATAPGTSPPPQPTSPQPSQPSSPVHPGASNTTSTTAPGLPIAAPEPSPPKT